MISSRFVRIGSFVSGGLILFFGVSTFLWKKKVLEKKEPLFSTVKPENFSIKKYINASGKLRAKDEIIVGSLVTGRVVAIYADDNDVVKKGQVLALLDDGVGYSGVEKALGELEIRQAELAFQEKTFDRQKKLKDKKLISDQEFDASIKALEQAKGGVHFAQAEVDIRKKTYENLFIRSPDDGIVIARKIELGQMVASIFNATQLFVIAKDLHEMEAYIDVDEADIGLIKKEQKGTFVVDSFPHAQFSSQVERIQYFADVVGGVVTYAAIFPVDNKDLLLRPGMTTNIDIKVAQAQDVLSVPNKALRVLPHLVEKVAKQLGYSFKPLDVHTKRTKRDSVWKALKDSFEEVEVQVGITDGKRTHILQGIESSDTLILDVAIEENASSFVQKLASQRR